MQCPETFGNVNAELHAEVDQNGLVSFATDHQGKDELNVFKAGLMQMVYGEVIRATPICANIGSVC